MYDFDAISDRRKSGSIKWDLYGDDILPLWVADMDFPVFKGIQTALEERIAHPFFGYQKKDPQILELICDWVFMHHRWAISPEDVMLITGVVSGFNWVASAFTDSTKGIAFQAPVYFPFFEIGKNQQVIQKEVPLIYSEGGYTIDFDLFEEVVCKETGLFLLCNPHNPVGRVFRKDELMHIADICIKHDLTICSDEIHSDLIYQGHTHHPIASISPEIAARTITLMAPSKTFNIPGLNFAFAICQNEQLRKELNNARRGILEHPNILATTAASAAYRDGGQWLKALLEYLQGNRDYLSSYLTKKIPEIKFNKPEGTYLAWLNCEALGLEPSPYAFFLEKAKVAFNEGKRFGGGADQFIRLNFGCPRSILIQALEDMVHALEYDGKE
jgi:cysteine-S-conjugate beta-lyase